MIFLHPAWGIPLGYVIGSIPFAYFAGKARGVDLRAHGSGNLGATNAARVLGTKTGVAVYMLDALKGVAAAALLPRLLGADPASIWPIAYGVAAVLGHVRPLFLGFAKGGKGVATAGGVFFGLAWLPALASAVIWGLVFLATGYVSVASLAGAIGLPLLLAIHSTWRGPVFFAGVALGVFVFWTHRANIARLRRGEEHRFNVGLRPRRKGS